MKASSYFEAQASLEITSRIESIMIRDGVTLDELARKMMLEPSILKECLDDGDKLTVNMIAEILYHLDYSMLFTTRPLRRDNHEQAERWSKS